MMVEQPAPFLDGAPLPAGFGVSIEPSDSDYLVPICGPFKAPQLLEAWITRETWCGYVHHQRVPPGSVVEMRFLDGREVRFCDGVTKVSRSVAVKEHWLLG